MTSRRVHEWAWGDVGERTVCGLARDLHRAQVVFDLGGTPDAQRCKNCERMRASIGASSRPIGGDRIEPTIVLSPGVVPGEISDLERAILVQATAWESRWPLHRNEFTASADHPAALVIGGLVARGLMKIIREPAANATSSARVYSVTAIGVAALKGKGRAKQSGGTMQPAE